MKKTAQPQSDISPKEKAEFLLAAALSKKALSPIILRLAELTSLADYFVIVSGQSARQVTAISQEVLDQARGSGFGRASSEGVTQGNWALLDYGDVVVHVFQQPVRDFYDLEGLWADAPREVLPPELLAELEQGNYEEDDDWD